MDDEVRTLTAPRTVEIEKIKGSRFVADAAPVGDEAAALAAVARVRDRAPDATHHCWAYRLAAGRERSDDDGEPRDTAGAPILQRIHGAGLADVVVVVTRWFGGTKLGRGGLIRAYGQAAAAVLDAADVVVRPAVVHADIAFDYDLSGIVDGLVAGHGVTVEEGDYGASVRMRLAVPKSAVSAFVDALAEETSGRVVADVAEI